MVNQKLLNLVHICELEYGSLERTPYLCSELKETRKLYPNPFQRGTTHPKIKSIKRDYENNYSMEEIRGHYHIRKDIVKFFADIYNWKRPKSYYVKHYN